MNPHIEGWKELIKVTKANANKLKTHICYRGFPKPLGRTNIGGFKKLIWSRAEVESWLKKHSFKDGRFYK